MARITSAPTAIRVESNSLLAGEARATSSNSFRVYPGGGLNNRLPHPTSRIPCDVTEDGQSAVHTIVDWCGKGVYDPITRRVQWMGKGTGNVSGGYVYNV